MSNPTMQTLKGFRDIMPEEKRQRDYVLSKILEIFKLYAFEPLETPTLEYADLLLGKYGEEADKLVYTFEDRGGRKVGLRYDQTVPVSRVLAQYRNNLPKFFRRYQVQNVFRADKPQKGRYREFTQCDIDIFATKSSVADAEILACTYQAYKNIGFTDIQLKINDRQTIFNTLEEYTNENVNVFSIIQSIDKLDKMSQEKVVAELVKKGLQPEQAQAALTAVAEAQPSPALQKIMELAINLGVDEQALVFTPTLTRGLDYYTGMIFEVIIPQFRQSSCGGGGRYDKLIEKLGGVDIPAVGFAFGFARTVEAAAQLNLIPEQNQTAQVLVAIFNEESLTQSLKIAQQFRQAGITTEVYPEPDRLGKQFKLANQKNINWVVVAGPDEIKQEKIALKNMETGEQQIISLQSALNKIINYNENLHLPTLYKQ